MTGEDMKDAAGAECVLVSGDRRMGMDMVRARAARVASGWRAQGIAEGDSVAILLRNCETFIEAAEAAARLGAYAVPVNWHNTPEEVRYILEDSGAKALVAHADLFHPIAGELPPGVQVLIVPTAPEIVAAYRLSPSQTALPQGHTLWEDFIAAHPPLDDPPPPQRNNMIYTSGTTGHPKGVRREPVSPETAPIRARLLREVFGIRPGIRVLINGPIYHSSPNAYALLSVPVAEQIVFQPRFDAEETLQLIERHGITHIHMVPIMFVRLLRLPPEVRARHDLSSLQWIIHGAAPCAPEVKRAMIAWWGPVINEYYGSTETSLNTCISSEEWLARPGSVGRAAHGSTLYILDDDGQPLPPGQVGRIFVRQQALSGFTYHGNEAKRRAMEHEGLLTVGDVGYLDAEGYLYLCDRAIDMVISGGVNIYPAEIEGVLINAPGVRDCAVFGIPDEEYGERLLAIVQLNDSVQPTDDAQTTGGNQPTPETLRAYLAEHLAEYKIPREFRFAQDLPREDSGKIFKRKLRAPFWEGRSRGI